MKHSTDATQTVVIHKNIHLVYTYESKPITIHNNHYNKYTKQIVSSRTNHDVASRTFSNIVAYYRINHLLDTSKV